MVVLNHTSYPCFYLVGYEFRLSGIWVNTFELLQEVHSPKHTWISRRSLCCCNKRRDIFLLLLSRNFVLFSVSKKLRNFSKIPASKDWVRIRFKHSKKTFHSIVNRGGIRSCTSCCRYTGTEFCKLLLQGGNFFRGVALARK